MTGLSLGDRIQLKLISRELDKVLLELDSFRDQKPGQRVRVLLKSGRAIEGVVNTASADHLSILSIPGDELHQIAARDLQRIQAAASNRGVVAITAAALGAGVGVAFAINGAVHSVLAGGIGGTLAIAAVTTLARTVVSRRRTWFTVWEAPPEPKSA